MERTGRLVRSPDRWIAGVLGGVAEHLGWPPTRVRIGFTLLSALSAAFPGILVYLLLWMIMPDGRSAEPENVGIEDRAGGG